MALDPVDDRSFQIGTYEVRSLSGRFIRNVGNHGGGTADIHELLKLPNGNWMMGRQVIRGGVDTSAFGGSANSRVVDIEIQEVTPGGRVVWRWNSGDHIRLAETGRWWNEPILDFEPYDIVHWNSVDVKGRYVILSFRHLDAVYKIDRRTGRIVWKLGGTRTPKRLDVVGDPLGNFPLGAQHDARFLSDGTISVYDNRSALPQPARVVRYRVNARAGRARLVQTFGERRTPISVCCGSARRVGRSWVVGWGGQFPDRRLQPPRPSPLVADNRQVHLSRELRHVKTAEAAAGAAGDGQGRAARRGDLIPRSLHSEPDQPGSASAPRRQPIAGEESLLPPARKGRPPRRDDAASLAHDGEKTGVCAGPDRH